MLGCLLSIYLKGSCSYETINKNIPALLFCCCQRKKTKTESWDNDSIKFFTLANEKYPQDPDILNYLAYTLKIVDDYIMAEIYYTQGLEINPKHVDINKNLGKLYVEINQISKAKERLAALKNCNCIEFDELRSLIQKN